MIDVHKLNFSFMNSFLPQDYLGPEIISHLGMHGPSVTGIIKNLITCLRKKEDDISIIYLESLKRVSFWQKDDIMSTIILRRFSEDANFCSLRILLTLCNWAGLSTVCK